MIVRFTRLVGVMLVIGLAMLPAMACSAAGSSECMPQTSYVVMGTPLSSRIDRVGDSIRAVLENPLSLNAATTLPAGTILKGHITAIRPSSRERAGQIQFVFTQANGLQAIFAQPATADTWLHSYDAETGIWDVLPGHSTRLLNAKLQGRLGADQSVWPQLLGINSTRIPDITTDEFIQSYNRHEVLVGVGDRIQLRFDCNAVQQGRWPGEAR